jgi:hypothetical protein
MILHKNWNLKLNKERNSQTQFWGFRTAEFNKITQGLPLVQETTTVILKIKKEVQEGWQYLNT